MDGYVWKDVIEIYSKIEHKIDSIKSIFGNVASGDRVGDLISSLNIKRSILAILHHFVLVISYFIHYITSLTSFVFYYHPATSLWYAFRSIIIAKSERNDFIIFNLFFLIFEAVETEFSIQ